MASSQINSLAELRELYGPPTHASFKKQATELNSTYKQWLVNSNFFVIASVGENDVDCTPRGDKHGSAFSIGDNKTILIPDRRGNRRLDTLGNLINDPRIALLFFIPGVEQALRIAGKASLSTSPELLDQFTLESKRPLCCIVVNIETVYFQNSRALARSELWQAEHQDTSSVPTPEQMLASVENDDNNTPGDN